jgi:hypothetical protein
VIYKKGELNMENTNAIEKQNEERIIRENPHLIPVKTSGKWGYIVAAKNIRLELKKTFPKIKFSVRSESYSGGNSIDIGYFDGPTAKRIENITDKYSGGSFNGMEDIYEYAHSIWTDVFGDSKYIFVNRHIAYTTAKIIFDKLIPEIQGNLTDKTAPILTENNGYFYIDRANDPDIFDQWNYNHTFSSMFHRLLTKLDFEKCTAENYNPKGLRKLFFK